MKRPSSNQITIVGLIAAYFVQAPVLPRTVSNVLALTIIGLILMEVGLRPPKRADLTDVEIQRIASHEAGHAIVASVSDGHELIDVTVYRQVTPGRSAAITGDTTHQRTARPNADQLFWDIVICVAGNEAEALIHGCSSSGGSDQSLALAVAQSLVNDGAILSHAGGTYCEDSEAVVELARGLTRALLTRELITSVVTEILSTPVRADCHRVEGSHIDAIVQQYFASEPHSQRLLETIATGRCAREAGEH